MLSQGTGEKPDVTDSFVAFVVESLAGYLKHEKISDASKPGKNVSRCASPRRFIVVASLGFSSASLLCISCRRA